VAAAPVPFDESLAWEIVAGMRGPEGEPLPMLRALQDRFGYVDARAVAMIAHALGLPRPEIFATLSSHREFRRQPPLGWAIKICLGKTCLSRGAQKLAARLERRLGLQIDGGARDGLSLETVLCFGLCAIGPNAQFDGAFFNGLDEAGIDALGARAAKER
jgi:formate dehydrogenase subunit gamma